MLTRDEELALIADIDARLPNGLKVRLFRGIDPECYIGSIIDPNSETVDMSRRFCVNPLGVTLPAQVKRQVTYAAVKMAESIAR